MGGVVVGDQARRLAEGRGRLVEVLGEQQSLAARAVGVAVLGIEAQRAVRPLDRVAAAAPDDLQGRAGDQRRRILAAAELDGAVHGLLGLFESSRVDREPGVLDEARDVARRVVEVLLREERGAVAVSGEAEDVGQQASRVDVRGVRGERAARRGPRLLEAAVLLVHPGAPEVQARGLAPNALRLGGDLEGVLQVRVLGHLREQREAADLGERRLVAVVEGDEHRRVGPAALRRGVVDERLEPSHPHVEGLFRIVLEGPVAIDLAGAQRVQAVDVRRHQVVHVPGPRVAPEERVARAPAHVRILRRVLDGREVEGDVAGEGRHVAARHPSAPRRGEEPEPEKRSGGSETPERRRRAEGEQRDPEVDVAIREREAPRGLGGGDEGQHHDAEAAEPGEHGAAPCARGPEQRGQPAADPQERGPHDSRSLGQLGSQRAEHRRIQGEQGVLQEATEELQAQADLAAGREAVVPGGPEEARVGSPKTATRRPYQRSKAAPRGVSPASLGRRRAVRSSATASRGTTMACSFARSAASVSRPATIEMRPASAARS